MADEKTETAPMLNSTIDPKVLKALPLIPRKPAKAAKGAALRQVWASFVANLGNINTGMVFGFTATALPQLRSADSIIQVTENESSWIASLSAVGTPVGCILSGYLMDTIGRRLTLIVTEVPLIIGWILIAVAQNVPMLYVGRLLVGLGSGMVSAPSGVYTCEVSQPHLRGMLGALTSVAVSFGVLIQYVIGSITSWNILAGVSSVIPILSLILMTTVPETPNYLLTRNKKERSEAALVKLRGPTCDVDEEIERMIAFKLKHHVEPLKSPGAIITALLSPSTLKPFAILSIYFFIYMWSGICIVTFHAVDLFEDSGASFDKHWLTIVMGIVRLIFTVIGCVMCRKFGRRILTFISAIGCGAAMVFLAVYLYFVQLWKESGTPPSHTWIPVACIFLYTVACTLGFLIIPWVMIGEVYPTQVRGIVGGMTTCVAHLSVFSVVKTYDFQREMLNDYGAFTLYGVMTLGGLIFFYLYLPETKDRTLQEIEDYFCGRTKTLSKKNSIQQGA